MKYIESKPNGDGTYDHTDVQSAYKAGSIVEFTAGGWRGKWFRATNEPGCGGLPIWEPGCKYRAAIPDTYGIHESSSTLREVKGDAGPAVAEMLLDRIKELEESIARGMAGAIKEGDGVWRSCTGCHELNEGHDTGAWSNVFKCHLGSGCRECGGIGAIWDDADYDAMAKSMQDQPAQPSDSRTEFSDTEMLDWLIEKEYAVRLMGGGYDLFDTDSGEWLDVDHPSAREAIKAAMRASEQS